MEKIPYHRTEGYKKSQKTYRQSEKGKAMLRRYNSSEKGRANSLRYKKSTKGKEAQRKYINSELGQAYIRRQRAHPNRNFYQRKYKKSIKGKLSAALERIRDKEKILARKFVNQQIDKGIIPPAISITCQCGSHARHYHHTHGYEKENWLKIIAVCIPCHLKLHSRNRSCH